MNSNYFHHPGITEPARRMLHTLVASHATSRGEAPALSFDARTWSYAALDKEFNDAARALAATGIKAGDRIAYFGKNNAEFVFLWGGAARIGAVLVPLNWRLAIAEIAAILADTRASLLLVGPEYVDQIDALTAAVPLLCTVIRCENAGPTGFRAWVRAHSAGTFAERTGTPSDILVKLYTSGTTGTPKGVLLTHDSLFAQRVESEAGGIVWDVQSPSDVLLVSLTVSHIGGLQTLARALYSGAHAVVLREFETGAVLRAIAGHRVSRLTVVPSTLQMLIRDPRIADTDTSSVRIVQYGASPIPLDLLREALAIFGCEFVQVYGMTETGGTVAVLPPDDHELTGNTRMKSVGLPLPGCKIRIVDPKDIELRSGIVGEIQVLSASLMAGYWNRPDESVAAVTRDGFLRTGDAGYKDDDGYIYLCDRIKDMICSGAENVYPAEVESAIYSHPDVFDVAVIGVPDERWGEAVKAIVVRRPHSQVSQRELIDFARTRIARFKVPKSIDFVDELPRNTAGKVQRRALREPYWVGREKRIN